MMREKKQSLWLFFLLTIISFALRLIQINQGLWYDEIYTLWGFVLKPWKEIISYMPVPNNHILYSLLAKLSIKLFGIKEWSVRVPALIIGGLIPGVYYLIFRKKMDELSAFFAGLFLAFSFWAVWFSQDARGYSGFILFSGLSHFLYLEWAEKRKMGLVLAYLLCSLALSYFFLYGIFVLVSQIGVGFWFWLKERGRKNLWQFILPILALGMVMALYVPGINQLLTYGLSPEGGREIGGRWFNLDFIKELLKMLSGSHYIWIALLASGFFVLGIYPLYREAGIFFWLYILSGLLIVFFTLIMKIFIYPRFLVLLMPVYYLGIALGIKWVSDKIQSLFPRIRRPIMRVALSVLVLVFLNVSLVRYYELGKQGFKKAGEYISRYYPERGVISLGMAREEFRYYYVYAEPVPGDVSLIPQEVIGKLVVASHPWSWLGANASLLNTFCKEEKVWRSAGYSENDVFLFVCF